MLALPWTSSLHLWLLKDGPRSTREKPTVTGIPLAAVPWPQKEARSFLKMSNWSDEQESKVRWRAERKRKGGRPTRGRGKGKGFSWQRISTDTSAKHSDGWFLSVKGGERAQNDTSYSAVTHQSNWKDSQIQGDNHSRVWKNLLFKMWGKGKDVGFFLYDMRDFKARVQSKPLSTVSSSVQREK